MVMLVWLCACGAGVHVVMLLFKGSICFFSKYQKLNQGINVNTAFVYSRPYFLLVAATPSPLSNSHRQSVDRFAWIMGHVSGRQVDSAHDDDDDGYFMGL